MNKILSIALLAFVLSSCQNSGDTETTETVTSDTTLMTAPATAATGMDAAATGADAQLQGVPSNTVTVPAATAAPVASTTSGATATGMNPEHGKPGHRCDISVGAPLNSPPGNAQAPAVTNAPAPTITQTPPPTSAPVPANAKLNPAHGQPGHDCKVPVGQPLKG